MLEDELVSRWIVLWNSRNRLGGGGKKFLTTMEVFSAVLIGNFTSLILPGAAFGICPASLEVLVVGDQSLARACNVCWISFFRVYHFMAGEE